MLWVWKDNRLILTALEWKRTERRMSKIDLDMMTLFRLVCIGGRLMSAHADLCSYDILSVEVSTYWSSFNRSWVCSLEWVSDYNYFSRVLISISCIIFNNIFHMCSICLRTSRGLSVGEFDNTETHSLFWINLHMF